MRRADASSLHRLTSLTDLDAALARSSDQPIVIFKHSPLCGISVQALEEVEALLAAEPIRLEVCLVDVLRNRPISNAIADRLRLRHESPQLLLLHQGQLRWHASHLRVTGRALLSALHQTAGR